MAQLVHDLRNRLTVIAGCAEAIRGDVPTREADENIDDIRHWAEQGRRLTRELLMAVRPQLVVRDVVDVNEVISASASTLRRLAGPEIMLRLRLSPDPLPVFADVTEVDRILLNLALNARDAMEGRGVLTVETGWQVHPSRGLVKDAREVPDVRLTVSDTGTGMTREVRVRMFEPFFTTKSTGTGLGLSSVAFTVQQLGGVATVDTEPGLGTSVTVILPSATA